MVYLPNLMSVLSSGIALEKSVFPYLPSQIAVPGKYIPLVFEIMSLSLSDLQVKVTSPKSMAILPFTSLIS